MSEDWVLAGNKAQRMWLNPCVTEGDWSDPQQAARRLGADKSPVVGARNYLRKEASNISFRVFADMRKGLLILAFFPHYPLVKSLCSDAVCVCAHECKLQVMGDGKIIHKLKWLDISRSWRVEVTTANYLEFRKILVALDSHFMKVIRLWVICWWYCRFSSDLQEVKDWETFISVVVLFLKLENRIYVMCGWTSSLRDGKEKVCTRHTCVQIWR